MKNFIQNLIFIKALFFFFLIANSSLSAAQLPVPALIGYFHNWQDFNTPYVALSQVDSRYNVIDVSFAIPQSGTDYQMVFVPDQVSQAVFKTEIQTVQAQGRKVIISIGGATAPVSLDNNMERDSFIASMSAIINTYGFDGMDIDLEGSSLSVSGGTISNPTDLPIINMIDAIKTIMANYCTANNKRLMLTMAPETAFVQGGQSGFGGIWGAYLPLIDALRDSIEILHVQLYNSGSMYGIDGNIYTQGTADFIVAMCEAMIQGFNTAGGMFIGFPANKIAVGLPACSSAAGGGFADTATVRSALEYLMGKGPQPNLYTLFNSSGYPDFRGMMTWSVNWDALATCGESYEYADNFQSIFSATPTSVELVDKHSIRVYPNPSNSFIHLDNSDQFSEYSKIYIYNTLGVLILSKNLFGFNKRVNISHLPAGSYYLKTEGYEGVILKY